MDSKVPTIFKTVNKVKALDKVNDTFKDVVLVNNMINVYGKIKVDQTEVKNSSS